MARPEPPKPNWALMRRALRDLANWRFPDRQAEQLRLDTIKHIVAELVKEQRRKWGLDNE